MVDRCILVVGWVVDVFALQVETLDDGFYFVIENSQSGQLLLYHPIYYLLQLSLLLLSEIDEILLYFVDAGDKFGLSWCSLLHFKPLNRVDTFRLSDSLINLIRLLELILYPCSLVIIESHQKLALQFLNQIIIYSLILIEDVDGLAAC